MMSSESSHETVFVSGGSTARTEHCDPECPRLLQSNKIVEKPRAVIPRGHYPICPICHGDCAENDRPLEEVDAP